MQGADIVVIDVDGKTALHWTANNADPQTVRALMELAPTAVNLKDNDGRTGGCVIVLCSFRMITLCVFL